jgi:threonine/homoserine/homoserine lactone efflux protein
MTSILIGLGSVAALYLLWHGICVLQEQMEDAQRREDEAQTRENEHA